MTAVRERAGATPVAAPRGGPLTGAREVVRLILRRDRIMLPAWIVIMSVLPVALAAATVQGYPTEASRIAFAAASAANPAELALRGPVFAPTAGALTAWTFGSSGVLLGGVVSLLLMVRHTRAEEQAGRRELLGSGVLGRHAPLAAALAVVTAGNAAIAVLVALGLIASGLPAAGSVALGLVIALGSIVFAAIGAVAAQVVEGAGAARGLGLGVLGVLFALVALGELGSSGLVWASPFGWARRVQSFAGDRWWVLLLFVVTAVALAAAAFALSARRDVGAGLIAARPGPAAAGPMLRSPLALAWRLHRGSVLGWFVGLTVGGLLLGSAMSSLGDQLDTPAFRELTGTVGGGDPGVVFFRFVLYVLSQVVTASAVVAALRMRTQETSGLADVVLAGPVGRLRWALGHVTVTVVGVALALAGLGLGAGVGFGTPLGIVGSTLAYLPACLVFAGLVVALLGWAPRFAAPVTWTVLGLALILDLLGEFRIVDEDVLLISPFVRTLTPLSSGSGLAAALCVLSGAAVALAAVGLAGLRRRDLDAA